MATLVLSAAGGALGGALGGGIAGIGAAAVGQALGGVVGGLIDQAVLGGGARAVETGRVDRLRVMGSREGTAVPRVYGRMRVAGQVIWASRFREEVSTASARGGKGGPRVEAREHRYTVSLAVGLCEGPVERIGRVWLDGAPLRAGTVELRLHRGGEDQAPDPLIEAVEGPGAAPAYRGLAYVVLEDLDLTPYGARTPQVAVEVFREPRALPGGPAPLSALVEAVALSPGSGEFSLETVPVRRVLGPGRTRAENVNSADGRPDALVALDQLQAEAPACRAASLIVSWFGDDLRCGRCAVRPKVEEADKATEGAVWSVSGVARAQAAVVGREGGRPVFGGTPSDGGVVASIRELAARGIDVMFYPFVLMDVAPGSGLPDPYGGAEQPAYPWRGRITLDAAPGRPGSSDGTAAAAAEVAAFFGAARAGDFVREGEAVRYVGPEDWGFRRFILHYAHLCAAAGGVDAFCIGSELRGLTWIRSGRGVYPAVAALRVLAAEVRAILPGAKIGYAADWSEYFGHRPDDGSGDVFFHLDPLWADPAINFVGIDNYMPLSDWRDGEDHADASARSVHSLVYLRGGIEGGEGYDWYYASDADRAAQLRTPIRDTAHGEDWVFRYKDVRRWWSEPHHDRPGGVRAAEPTAWAPMSKPVWFTEIGCPAVDKGANQPNVFVDPKSSESALPHFSSGARDEHMQRRFLQAQLGYWAEPEINPVSPVYGGPMIDIGRAFVWTWDLRPWPDFPQRLDAWSDGENHRLGHWITGRLGAAGLGEIVAEVCAEAGLEGWDVSALEATVEGYAQDAVQSGRQALQPLMLAYGFEAVEAAGTLRFAPRARRAVATVEPADCVAAREGGPVTMARTAGVDAPEAVRVGYVAADGAYEATVAEARRPGGARRVDGAELPIAMAEEAAQALAERWAREASAARETARFALPPSAAALEPGDVVRLDAGLGPRLWRIERIAEAGERRVEARRLSGAPTSAAAAPVRRAAAPLARREPVVAWTLDAPAYGEGEPHWPLIAAFAWPWPGGATLWRDAGAAGWEVALRLDRPATTGALAAPLPAAAPWRWSRGAPLEVALHGGALQGATEADVLAGANLAAVESAPGRWEALQFATATLVGPARWRLGPLLRGQGGTETVIGDPAPAGARFVALDGAVRRLPTPLDALGLERRFRIGPVGADVGDEVCRELAVTAEGLGLRPLAPAHLRAQAAPGGALALSWVRRTRVGGDGWGAVEPPLAEESERYRLRVIVSGETRREAWPTTTAFHYGAADRAADAAGGPLEIAVAQVSATTGPGAEARIRIDG